VTETTGATAIRPKLSILIHTYYPKKQRAVADLANCLTKLLLLASVLLSLSISDSVSVSARLQSFITFCSGCWKINAYKSLDALTLVTSLFMASGFMRRIFIYEQQFAGCFKTQTETTHKEREREREREREKERAVVN